MTRPNRVEKQKSRKFDRLVKSLQRKRNARELNCRFLIVCEDQKSAPRYLEELRRQWSLSSYQILVAGSEGHTQPVQVVDKAIATNKENNKNTSSTVPFDQVWCLIDGDYGDAVTPARAKAISNKIKLAISTPCFEYWLILHFEDFRKTQQTSSQIESHLRKHISGYDKGKTPFETVIPLIQTAMKNAKAGRERQKTTYPLAESHNPCSELYLLIEAIQSNLN